MKESLAMTVKSWPLLLAACLSFLILAIVLVSVVVRLLRSNREQIVATLSLREEQELELFHPASLLLMVEVPRIGPNFRSLEFDIIEKATGHSTRLTYDFVRAQGAIYGWTTMRVPIGPVNIPRAGTYLVGISGLQPATEYTTSHLLFSKPYLGRMVWQIIGIVFCAIGLLLSLLLGAWQLFELQHG